MAPCAALNSVEAVIWPSVIFLLSIPRGSEHAIQSRKNISAENYSASLSSIVTALRTCNLDAYLHFPVVHHSQHKVRKIIVKVLLATKSF